MQASWEYPQELFGWLVKSLDLACTGGGSCFGLFCKEDLVKTCSFLCMKNDKLDQSNRV